MAPPKRNKRQYYQGRDRHTIYVACEADLYDALWQMQSAIRQSEHRHVGLGVLMQEMLREHPKMQALLQAQRRTERCHNAQAP